MEVRNKRIVLKFLFVVMSMIYFMGFGKNVFAAELVSSTNLSLNSSSVHVYMQNEDQSEYYKVTLPKAGELVLTVTNENNTAQTTEPKILFYDELFSTQYSDFKIKSIGVPATQTETLYLYAGTYYLRIEANGSSGYSVGVSAKYTEVSGSDVNSAYENPAGAIQVNFNQEYQGLLAHEAGGFNYYKLILPVASRINVTSYQNTDLVFCIMESNAADEVSRDQLGSPSGTVTKELSAGTYYLRFGGNGLFWTSNKCMYKFSVTQIISVSKVSIPSKKTIVAGRKIKLTTSISPDNASDKTVTWSSSDSDIVTVDSKGNVKGINSGKAIITAKSNDNDQAYAECVVIVKPKKPSVGKISSYRYGKKKRHVYFSVNSKVRYMGYQTKWSKSKKMTKAKTTKKTDKYLKKGKYYFQMRTYVEIDGKKYYSAWSKVKKVKVK